MLTIYGFSTFNNTKVLLTAEELGLDYKYEFVDLGKGDNKTPEYLAIHPMGKTPALQHNGNTIMESATICRYLSNISDKRLYSADPMEAAKIDQLIDFMSIHIGRWLGAYFWQEIIKKKYFKQEPDANVLKEAAGFLEQQLPYLDGLLAERDFLAGSDLTIADTVAFPYFQAVASTSFDVSPYKNIARWIADMSQRPSTKKINDLFSK